MRKTSAILIAGILALALSACTLTIDLGGNTGEQNANSDTQPVQSVQNSTTQSTQPVESKASVADNTLQSSKDQQVSQPTQAETSSKQQTAQATDNQLSQDEAVNIALKQAGVIRDSIRELETELDNDDGVLIWEIKFEAGNTEYKFDIHAKTGTILERDRDKED